MDVQTPSLERPPVEAPKAHAFEAAMESPESAIAFLENADAKDIVEVKDFTGKFPEIGPDAKARADAVESRIRSLEKAASAEIAQVVRPPEKSPAVIAGELLQRAPLEAVKATPIISVGGVPEKLRGRVTPEDLAAVTARKIIPIGGEKSFAVASESPKPENAPAAPVEKNIEQEAELALIEANFAETNAVADALFRKGDLKGMENLLEDLNATIEKASLKIIEMKKERPDPSKMSRKELYGFIVGKTLLDIQMARRERTEAQMELLKQKQAGASAEDVAVTRGKIDRLDAEIKGKIAQMINLKKEKTVAEEKKVEEDFGGWWEGYGGPSFGGYGLGSTAASGQKMPEIAEPLKAKLITGAEAALDVLASPLTRWMDFTVSGKSSIIEELTRWGDQLGRSKGYQKSPKA